MEMMTITTLCLATLFIFILSKLLRFKSPNLPPGPKSWPIIGNLHQMGELPHRSIHSLSKKYGPLMQLRFGSYPVVVGSSVEMAEIFLKTMDLNFADRPPFAAGKYTNYNFSDITWSPYGHYWRQARKMCLTELFSARRLESYEFIRVEEMKIFLRETFESAGKLIPLREHLATLTTNVISRMVMGKRYMVGITENNHISPKDFKKLVDEWFFLNGVLNMSDFIPWLGFLDLQGYVKRMKQLHKSFDRFLEHVVDDHEEARKANKGLNLNKTKDMVDVLLDHANDPTFEVKLERSEVKAITQDLIVGGTESSAMMVEWAIAELIKNPVLLKRATNELDRVVGQARWVDERDMPNLPYIEAIVKETLRLHPLTILLSPRMTREDCKIDGYDIKGGTCVFLNTWTIHRDPKHWEDPETFRPERFLGKEKNIDVKGNHFKLLPFGAGRRMCLGLNLGLKVIQYSLANLLHGFNWKLPKTMNLADLDMDETFGLSAPKKIPLVAIASPRLPRHLYLSL